MKRIWGIVVTAAMLLSCTGCGTLFFSHRMGKKSSKVIDKRVFYTNCFLCLFGVIPGVVAFILDYDSETIYYTEAELMPDDLFGIKRLKEMKRIPCGRMSCEEVARLLSEASGKNISSREVQIALKRAGTPELL